MATRVFALSEQANWTELESLLRENQANPILVPTLIRHLRELGAVSGLFDAEYLDRDFSEAYSAFYSKTFKRHSKTCRRLLFFSCDLSMLKNLSPCVAAAQLQELAGSSYLGHVVLRPISQAPLAQVILRAPQAPQTFEGHLLVRSRYHAHALGAELAVEAVPMTQQDQRLGACVQASIWVAARHFHSKHRGPWLSTVDITEAAISNPEHAVNRSLPAGSEGLMPNNTVAALRAAGRETLIQGALGIRDGKPDWGNLRPSDIINRYIDSGIPVIVWLTTPGQNVDHAVVATGQVLRSTPARTLPRHATRAEYLEALYINDDQRGPNIRVGIRPGCGIAETGDYSIDENTALLIIPLPEKVYLPAETAEAFAWGLIEHYGRTWNDHKGLHTQTLGTSAPLGDEVVQDLQANKVVARTYLTYGWKHKHRALRNDLSETTLKIIRDLELPRYVYVTEFSLQRQIDGRSQFERRIIAHCVVDATAKNQDFESVLLFHAPGFCRWTTHTSQAQGLAVFVAPSTDDREYFPKARGEIDFRKFSNQEAAN